ncbi:MAG: hypothetical protein GVY14_04230, partial [Spirochaetes bacterium]|nr:hypothetical protein [Spirochaetota bacterium]
MSARGRVSIYVVPALVITAFAVFVFSESVQEMTLTTLFPDEPEHIY